LPYKSIDAILSELEAATPPRLVRFVPTYDPDESEKRELFMPPALHGWLYQGDRKKSRDFSANIRAFLGKYVKGAEVDNEHYMKNWIGDVWELRVQNQRKGERVRVFGAFAKQDVFVAFFQRPRSAFGGINDPRWKEVTDRTVDEWDKLFPPGRQVRARPFSNCVSSKYFDVHEG